MRFKLRNDSWTQVRDDKGAMMIMIGKITQTHTQTHAHICLCAHKH